MTVGNNPPAGPTPAEQALAENAAQVAILLELEHRAVEAASGLLRRLLNVSLRRATNQYVLQFGSLQAPADPERIRPILDELLADIEDLRGYTPAPSIQSLIDEAVRAGVVWGARGAPGPVLPDGVRNSHAVQQLIDEIPANVSAAVDETRQFAQLTRVTTWSDVVSVVGKAYRAATSVDRSAAVAVATAMNDAVEQVAAQSGARVLWVAEPNACVVCLALSGHLADPSTGEWFDEEATFGRPGTAPGVWPPGEPLKRPPRHPHCRCVTQTWWGDARSEGVFDLPAALRREAKRSILLGKSVPTESNNVRLDAARRLLQLGSGLPRSVEARSRRAVQTGRFSHRTH